MLSNDKLTAAIETMTTAIQAILTGNSCTVYIFGSVALGDFRLGWSDIDILCLTKLPISDEAANRLVNLRQTLLSDEPNNPYYRSFEGGIAHINDFLCAKSCRAVYWGTSGQRITANYVLDSFSKKELLNSGILVCGDDIRSRMTMPSFKELYDGVVYHYATIRNHAVSVPCDIKSYGWMLDIARCIYTLRTGEIIAKTAAAEWALENDLCPMPNVLRRTLLFRKNPLKYKNDKEALGYTARLGNDIQRFADVLEREIKL